MARLYDADGKPVLGERVQFDFVNDDGSLAPAAGDVNELTLHQILDYMNPSKGFRYPLGNTLGSRQSR